MRPYVDSKAPPCVPLRPLPSARLAQLLAHLEDMKEDVEKGWADGEGTVFSSVCARHGAAGAVPRRQLHGYSFCRHVSKWVGMQYDCDVMDNLQLWICCTHLQLYPTFIITITTRPRPTPPLCSVRKSSQTCVQCYTNSLAHTSNNPYWRNINSYTLHPTTTTTRDTRDTCLCLT